MSVCSDSARRPRFSALRSGVLSLLAVIGCTPVMPGNNGNTGANGNSSQPEPNFPADYRSNFRLVRDCRTSIEHEATIRVFVNEIGADAYLADTDPLPLGSIVIKEEFDGIDCENDGELAFWSVMVKREAGFDPDDNDWQWQEVAAGRRVTLNDKATCIRCHREPECVERDYMCTLP